MTIPRDPENSASNLPSDKSPKSPGQPVLGQLPTWPPDWPEIRDAVAQAVTRGDWGRYRGPSCEALAARVAELTATRHVRLVSSGSVAVEIALRILGISEGQHVALCGYDYPGNFRAIELVGARPLLVDADAGSFSVDPDELQQLSAGAVSAVVVSHLYGVPARIQAIAELCRDRGWRLVEDACQVPGMMVDGRPAGSWGDVGVFSFGGSKPLTAGNGGALSTASEAVASRWRALLDRPSDAVPISELQACVLLPQLDRLAECNRIRGETLEAILGAVPKLAMLLGACRPQPAATCYKLAWLSPNRDATIWRLLEAGLPAGPGYRSMHRSSNRRCSKAGPLERCRQLGERLCLLDHSVLLATGSQRGHLITRMNSVPLD